MQAICSLQNSSAKRRLGLSHIPVPAGSFFGYLDAGDVTADPVHVGIKRRVFLRHAHHDLRHQATDEPLHPQSGQIKAKSPQSGLLLRAQGFLQGA